MFPRSLVWIKWRIGVILSSSLENPLQPIGSVNASFPLSTNSFPKEDGRNSSSEWNQIFRLWKQLFLVLAALMWRLRPIHSSGVSCALSLRPERSCTGSNISRSSAGMMRSVRGGKASQGRSLPWGNPAGYGKTSVRFQALVWADPRSLVFTAHPSPDPAGHERISDAIWVAS